MLKILIPEQGETAYLKAAEAFRGMYEKVTGQTPEIIARYEPGTDLAVIGSDSVNDFTAQAFAKDWIDSFRIRYGTDDYAIRSVRDGDRTYLFLAGGRGRSTLYAVYDYFERAAGCHYYWDGDVIPHLDALPLDGFDVAESPRFDWRGLRYFAHRGLHRFQAEHWSLDDWKKEIDWMVKRRLNYFMLRIGHDDVFQRAFPDAVDYPNATEKLPEATDGYDDRTLFWPLEFRSVLRKKVMEYAFERDLIHSEDFGTMTHWYSRTPVQYLEKKKPVLLDQSSKGATQTSLCWDPRISENLDNYMKITDVYVSEYGRPDVLHTIGMSERIISSDRRENVKIKYYTYRRILQRVMQKYPTSHILVTGWEFAGFWHNDEIPPFLSELDPQRMTILDYTSDHDDPERTFPAWGILGKFPWILGLFHAYERNSDVHGNYDRIKERLEIASADSMCRGMVIWPEMSHSDTLMFEYFCRNSWKPDQLDVEPVAAEFSSQRYGAWGGAMYSVWQAFLPIMKLVEWGVYSRRQPDDPEYEMYSHHWMDNGCYPMDMLESCVPVTLEQGPFTAHWRYKLRKAAELNGAPRTILTGLSLLPDQALENPFVYRDVIDIARSLIERWMHWGIFKLILMRAEFMNGADNASGIEELCASILALSEKEAQVLGCHADYSMARTYAFLESVCPVNPCYRDSIKRNLVNRYCRQACYEPYKYLFLDEQKAYFSWIVDNVRAGNRGEWENPFGETEKALFNRFMETPLEDMKSPCRGDLKRILAEAADAISAIQF